MRGAVRSGMGTDSALLAGVCMQELCTFVRVLLEVCIHVYIYINPANADKREGDISLIYL